MVEPPELVAYVVVISVLIVGGGMVTAVSYRAYRRVRRLGLLLATIGFASITVGGGISLVYEFGLKQDYRLGGRELLVLQTIEATMIAAGFILIFVALSRY